MEHDTIPGYNLDASNAPLGLALQVKQGPSKGKQKKGGEGQDGLLGVFSIAVGLAGVRVRRSQYLCSSCPDPAGPILALSSQPMETKPQRGICSPSPLSGECSRIRRSLDPLSAPQQPLTFLAEVGGSSAQSRAALHGFALPVPMVCPLHG